MDDPKAEQKHVTFYRQINRLSDSLLELRKLADKVEGTTPPAELQKEADAGIPSLTYFLSIEPKRLDGMNNDLLAQLERLEQMLF